jgi:stringent starvation protein B
MNRDNVPSTRPYLIRALHEWCTENGFTPYIAVAVDDTVQVPREFVKNNEVVLNTSLDATSHLQPGQRIRVEFKARFFRGGPRSAGAGGPCDCHLRA